MRTFCKRYPMVEYLFTYRGVDTGKTYYFSVTANIEYQAEFEARELLERQHGEVMELTSTVGVKKGAN